MKLTETQLVKAALDYLAMCGFKVWRQNTGAFAGEYKGKRRFVRFGVPGVSDIIGLAPDGRFAAFEAKVGKNKLTEDQADFLAMVEDRGGVWAVFYTLNELRTQLVRHGYTVV